MSNPDAIASSPESVGLGEAPVAEGDAGATTTGAAGVGFVGSLSTDFAFETLQPDKIAKRISGASAFVRFFKMLVTPTGLYFVGRPQRNLTPKSHTQQAFIELRPTVGTLYSLPVTTTHQ